MNRKTTLLDLKLDFSNIPIDIQRSIVEYFGSDEWKSLVSSKMFKHIDFKNVDNYKLVNIFILPDGTLSKKLCKHDLYKRFIVTPATVKFLLAYADTVQDILINMKESPFDTVPDDIEFKEHRSSSDEEIYAMYQEYLNGDFGDADYYQDDASLDAIEEVVSDNHDVTDSEYLYNDDSEHQLSENGQEQLVIPYLPNLRKIYIGYNNKYSVIIDNINSSNVTKYWLQSGFYTPAD